MSTRQTRVFVAKTTVIKKKLNDLKVRKIKRLSLVHKR
jgi:hypothetical protein